MYYWILTIFKLQDRLCHYADKLDRDAMREALNLNKETMKAYDNILKLNDKKLKVVNMKVLADYLTNSLDNKDCFVVKSYVRGATFDQLGKALGQNKSSPFRRFKRTMQKCEMLLKKLGYDENRLLSEYGNYAPIYGAFVKVKKLTEKSCNN